MHLLSLPPPPPAASTSISIRTALLPFSFFLQRCSTTLSQVVVGFHAIHVANTSIPSTCPCHLAPGMSRSVLSFLVPLRPLSRDAFTTISRSKLTATSSVPGYNSLERQVCQRPSYSVHARSVEGHYRLLSGCNRPRATVHARSCREASRRISDFVCATSLDLLAPAAGESGWKILCRENFFLFFSFFMLPVFRFLNTRHELFIYIWIVCRLLWRIFLYFWLGLVR